MRMGLMGFGVDGISGDYLCQPGGTFVEIDARNTGGGGGPDITQKRSEPSRNLVESPIRIQFSNTEEALDLGQFRVRFGVSPAAILRYHRDPEDRGSDGGVQRALIDQSIGRGGFDHTHIACVAAQAEVIEAHVAMRHHIAALLPKEALAVLFGAARQQIPISQSYLYDLLNSAFGSGAVLITTALHGFFEAHQERTPDGIAFLSGENVMRFMVEKILPLAVEKTPQYTETSLRLYAEARLSSAELGSIERDAATNPYLMTRIAAITTRAATNP